MPRYIVDALLSMFFAGVTAVVAKRGLQGVSPEVGLAVRTTLVFVFTIAFTSTMVPPGKLLAIPRASLFWLALSAVATTLSWWFYNRALKVGDVATVALIDKGSIVVTVLLAWLVLREPVHWRTWAGLALVAMGLIVVAKR